MKLSELRNAVGDDFKVFVGFLKQGYDNQREVHIHCLKCSWKDTKYMSVIKNAGSETVTFFVKHKEWHKENPDGDYDKYHKNKASREMTRVINGAFARMR